MSYFKKKVAYAGLLGCGCCASASCSAIRSKRRLYVANAAAASAGSVKSISGEDERATAEDELPRGGELNEELDIFQSGVRKGEKGERKLGRPTELNTRHWL